MFFKVIFNLFFYFEENDFWSKENIFLWISLPENRLPTDLTPAPDPPQLWPETRISTSPQTQLPTSNPVPYLDPRLTQIWFLKQKSHILQNLLTYLGEYTMVNITYQSMISYVLTYDFYIHIVKDYEWSVVSIVNIHTNKYLHKIWGSFHKTRYVFMVAYVTK